MGNAISWYDTSHFFCFVRLGRNKVFQIALKWERPDQNLIRNGLSLVYYSLINLSFNKPAIPKVETAVKFDVIFFHQTSCRGAACA